MTEGAPQGFVLGVDVGGTTSAIGLVERGGRLAADAAFPTRPERGPEAFVEMLSARVEEALRGLRAELPGARPLAVGIGAPNANGPRGTVEHAHNLGWGARVPLAAMVARALGTPAVLANDANAAAVGEQRFGAARGLDDFLLVTLGTGVGSGFFAGGELLLGHDGLAGELGHLVIEPGGRPCPCGKRGCLEAYASATALVGRVREELARGRPSSLAARSGELDGRAIGEAARGGDALAREAFEELGLRLGHGLANAVMITSPARIVLFGGLVGAGELLLAPTRRALGADLAAMHRGGVELVPSALDGAHAAVLGAAALAWRALERGELARA